MRSLRDWERVGSIPTVGPIRSERCCVPVSNTDGGAVRFRLRPRWHAKSYWRGSPALKPGGRKAWRGSNPPHASLHFSFFCTSAQQSSSRLARFVSNQNRQPCADLWMCRIECSVHDGSAASSHPLAGSAGLMPSPCVATTTRARTQFGTEGLRDLTKEFVGQ